MTRQSARHRATAIALAALAIGISAPVAGARPFDLNGPDSVAPVHVVIGVREASYHERYQKDDKLVDGREITWPAPYWYVDSGSLFMLIQLAALSEGLSAGVYGVPGEAVPELKQLLGMPDDVHFNCIVTIGKQPPDADDSAQVSRLTQRRLPLEEIVHWEHWHS